MVFLLALLAVNTALSVRGNLRRIPLAFALIQYDGDFQNQ